MRRGEFIHPQKRCDRSGAVGIQSTQIYKPLRPMFCHGRTRRGAALVIANRMGLSIQSSRKTARLQFAFKHRRTTRVRKMGGMKTPIPQPTQRVESSRRPSVPPFTPGPPREAAVRKYFARGEMERITANRWFLATVFLSLLTLVNSVAWIVALPLKTIQTIVVHEESSGRQTPDLSGTSSYVPDHAAVEYFLSEFINNVYDINASTIDHNLALAGKMTVGEATDQLNALLHKVNPYSKLHDNPQLRQTFNRLTANWLTDDTLIIRFTLTDIDAPGSTPKTTTWAMTLTFVRIPPTTLDQVKINPGGIYVKNFNVNQEQ